MFHVDVLVALDSLGFAQQPRFNLLGQHARHKLNQWSLLLSVSQLRTRRRLILRKLNWLVFFGHMPTLDFGGLATALGGGCDVGKSDVAPGRGPLGMGGQYLRPPM